MSNTKKPYDDVFFQSHPTPERHPQRLAVLSRLFKVSHKSFKEANILEIGCGTGMHLIAQAHDLPDAQFVGIDSSKEHIRRAKEMLFETGLHNVRFIHGDIATPNIFVKHFDYIICHGMYSWVSSEVQESILDLVKSRLTPDGILLLSYNALPGWGVRDTIRSILCSLKDAKHSYQEQLEHARTFLTSYKDMLVDASEPHELKLQKEIEQCLKRSDGFLLHEMLNDDAKGYYLNDMVDLGHKYDLQYIGDAQPYRMHRPSLREDSSSVPKESLKYFTTPALFEGMYDSIYPQAIRSSLFCKAENTVVSTPDFHSILDLYVASPLVPIKEPVDIQSEEPVEFGTHNQDTLDITSKILKSAFTVLNRTWPEVLKGQELFELSWGLIGDGEPFGHVKDEFCLGLVRYFSIGLVELYEEPLRAVSKMSETPKACPFVRYQMKHQPWVTTSRHEIFVPNELHKKLLEVSDGKHSKEQILKILIAQYNQGSLHVHEDGQALSDPEAVKKLLLEGVENGFLELVEVGLLVG